MLVETTMVGRSGESDGPVDAAELPQAVTNKTAASSEASRAFTGWP